MIGSYGQDLAEIFNSSSENVFSTASLNYSYYFYSSVICYSFTFTTCLDSMSLYIVLVWGYGLTKRTEFTLGLCCTNVDLGGSELDVS